MILINFLKYNLILFYFILFNKKDEKITFLEIKILKLLISIYNI